MFRRHLLLAGVALLAGGIVITQAQGPALADTTTATPGKPAPAFKAVDVNGKPVSLADFRGKTVVLEWTNHECPFVQKHYKSGNMQNLQKAAAAEGVVWLTLLSSAPGEQGHVSVEQAKQLTAERNAAPGNVLFDTDGRIGKLYGAQVTPHMYVIDAKGVLAYAGAIDDKPSTRLADVDGARNYVREAVAAAKAGKTMDPPVTRAYGCTIKYVS
jgi:peroxiredoxin